MRCRFCGEATNVANARDYERASAGVCAPCWRAQRVADARLERSRERRFLADDTPRDQTPNYQPMANASIDARALQTTYLQVRTFTAPNGAIVTVALPRQ